MSCNKMNELQQNINLVACDFIRFHLIVTLKQNIKFVLASSPISLVYGFEWVESTSQLNEYFIKNYDEDSDIGYFLEANVKYPEKLQ